MLRLQIKMDGLGSSANAGLTNRILARFQKAAGELVTKAVQEVLGHDDIYTLTDNYKAVKPRRRGFQRQAGKDADQPLIFSGSLYSGVGWHLEGDLIVIQVADDHGLDARGDDYAEIWEQRVDYLEKGLEAVEDELPDLLLDIVVEEMML